MSRHLDSYSGQLAQSHKSCDKFRGVKEAGSLLSDQRFFLFFAANADQEEVDLRLFVRVKWTELKKKQQKKIATRVASI